jgi:hypothetical protein
MGCMEDHGQDGPGALVGEERDGFGGRLIRALLLDEQAHCCEHVQQDGQPPKVGVQRFGKVLCRGGLFLEIGEEVQLDRCQQNPALHELAGQLQHGFGGVVDHVSFALAKNRIGPWFCSITSSRAPDPISFGVID